MAERKQMAISLLRSENVSLISLPFFWILGLLSFLRLLRFFFSNTRQMEKIKGELIISCWCKN